MRNICLILLVHTSVQLRCDKRQIQTYVGENIQLICSYEVKGFLFSKKYWCRGESRTTCEILADTEAKFKPRARYHIIDKHRAGLLFIMTALKLEDSGLYWMGIDKIHFDIMVSVQVNVTEVPVSKPQLWPMSPLAVTCWGQPVTVRCASQRGTAVDYAWYQRLEPQGTLLVQPSPDLHFHCGSVGGEYRQYHCTATNAVSSKQSGLVLVQVLLPAENDCVYIVTVDGQSEYDCADRLATSTAQSPSTRQTTEELPQSFGTTSQSTYINTTCERELNSRAWAGLPLWYEVVRWFGLALLLVSLCLVHRCSAPGSTGTHRYPL